MILADQSTMLSVGAFAAIAVGVALGLLAILPFWDGIVTRYIGDITPQMQAIGLDTDDLPMYMRIWGATMAGVFILLWFVLGMWPCAIGATLFVYALPRILLEGAIRKRRTLLRDQLVGSGVALANSCRAGLSLPQAFDTVGREIQEPLATEFRRISRDYSAGRPFGEALNDVKLRLDLDSFTLFSSAILVCIRAGGNLTVALERISENLLENQRLERKLEADTQSGRSVVAMLVFFPWIFLGGFYLMEPQGTGLMFTTLPGQLVICVIGLLSYISYRWATKILEIDI